VVEGVVREVLFADITYSFRYPCSTAGLCGMSDYFKHITYLHAFGSWKLRGEGHVMCSVCRDGGRGSRAKAESHLLDLSRITCAINWRCLFYRVEEQVLGLIS